MREKMINKLDELMYFRESFRVSVKFKGNWIEPHLTDYKTMNDNDLFEFYSTTIRACSQPMG